MTGDKFTARGYPIAIGARHLRQGARQAALRQRVHRDASERLGQSTLVGLACVRAAYPGEERDLAPRGVSRELPRAPAPGLQRADAQSAFRFVADIRPSWPRSSSNETF